MIVAKLKRGGFTCEMCKQHKIGTYPYVYETFEVGDIPSEELKICKKCAKREHGDKNKHKLEDVIEERTKKWLNKKSQE